MENEKITCPSCGELVDNDSKFCPVCGAQIAKEATIETEIVNNEEVAVATELVNSSFVQSIVSVALTEIPIGSIVAIVLASKAQQKLTVAKNLSEKGNFQLSKKTVATRILSKIGKILGIVMTVIWPIYFIVIAVYAFLLAMSEIQ